MKHFASPDFWFYYRLLPEKIQELADKNFALLKENPRHASLRLKKVGSFWSVRIGISYRAIGKEREEGVVWMWIGSHAEYEQLIK
ncbi:MAG: hypothetical protein LR015_02230 [Verrucomicrobia bacterium]|nr:hypothetical protein [Verrucomicrobiota bacterium]